MSLRIFSLALALLLPACREKTPDPVADAKQEDRVACAMGAAPFASDCAIEVQDGLITVRHSDGSFRRFEIGEDGALASADGADDVTGTRAADGSYDVRVSDAHYRFAPGQLP